MQLMRSSAKFGNIDNILVTHLHGDHCYGLFGLLHTLNMTDRKTPVNVYGPPGVNELLTTVFRLSGGWDGFEIKVSELEPGRVHAFDLVSSNKVKLASVHACPMVHRIPAFGYVFQEPEQPRVLDANKAKSFGLEGRNLGRLKAGEDVQTSDGTIVKSAFVTSPGRPSRKIGIMQDTSDASSAIPYLSNCDLLVHEATFEKAMTEKAELYGHSTSVMAAEMAKKVNARNLVMTHFSSRYGDKGDNEILREEALEFLGEESATRVQLAEDFMCFSGPDFSTISSILPDSV
jgi:ribonuclease Z